MEIDAERFEPGVPNGYFKCVSFRQKCTHCRDSVHFPGGSKRHFRMAAKMPHSSPECDRLLQPKMWP